MGLTMHQIWQHYDIAEMLRCESIADRTNDSTAYDIAKMKRTAKQEKREKKAKARLLKLGIIKEVESKLVANPLHQKFHEEFMKSQPKVKK